jgi:hypothetical protein
VSITNNTPLKNATEVSKYMLEILVHIKGLLELYQRFFKNEMDIIDLLVKEIEQISEEGK